MKSAARGNCDVIGKDHNVGPAQILASYVRSILTVNQEAPKRMMLKLCRAGLVRYITSQTFLPAMMPGPRRI